MNTVIDKRQDDYDINSVMSMKRFAAARFAESSLPSNKEETWRKIRLQDFDFSSFFSKQTNHSNLQLESSAQGVYCCSFTDAMQEPSLRDILQQHLRQSIAEATDYFAWQNLAEWQQSFVVHIAKDLEQPLLLRHNLVQGGAVIHRVLFIVAANAQATVVEQFGNDNEPNKNEGSSCYWNVVSSACVGQNAHLCYISQRNYSTEDYHFQRFFCEQGRNSQVLAGIFHSGGRLGKGFCRARLLEPYATFRGIGAYVGFGQEFHDMEMLAEHRAGSSQSSLLYKAVVSGRAHSVFDGKLFIHKGIKKIRSRQMNHNMLLDIKARAETIPRLVIQSEDVSCEHGATVGLLDKEALFYLLSRGIGDSEARYLLLEGFLMEVMREFPQRFWQQSQERWLAIFRRELSL